MSISPLKNIYKIEQFFGIFILNEIIKIQNITRSIKGLTKILKNDKV